MSILSAARASRSTGAALACVGVLWGSLAASWPDIKQAVGASDAQLGFALLFSAAGGVLAMLAAPWLGRTLGRWTLPATGIAVAAALLGPLLAGSVPGLAAALFVIGVTVASLDVLANVEISARETRLGAHLMGFNHAMFSFAFAGAALAAAQARRAGLAPPDYLPWMAAICLVLALLCWDKRSAGEAGPQGTEAHAPLPWGAVTLTGVILFASFIGENATESWSALHIERSLHAPAGEGGLGPAVLGLVMGIGRLFGQVVAERLGHGRLILGSALLGVIGALVIAAAGAPWVVLLGVAIVAIGMAVVVPSAMSLLGIRVSDKARALALSRAWMLGIFGFFVGPALIGGISELFGLRLAFVAVAAIMALIVPAIWALDLRRGRS